MTRAILGTLAAALLFCAPAKAFTAAEGLAVAEAYWHGPPPLCTSVHLEVRDDFPSARDIGEAPIPNEPMPCYIELRAGIRKAWVKCQVIVHEYGHLMGYGHSPNPRNVMYPWVTRESTPRACWSAIR